MKIDSKKFSTMDLANAYCGGKRAAAYGLVTFLVEVGFIAESEDKAERAPGSKGKPASLYTATEKMPTVWHNAVFGTK